MRGPRVGARRGARRGLRPGARAALAGRGPGWPADLRADARFAPRLWLRRLIASGPEPHPSRPPLRWAGRRGTARPVRSWMLVGAALYLQEQVRGVSDTETGRAVGGPAHRGRLLHHRTRRHHRTGAPGRASVTA